MQRTHVSKRLTALLLTLVMLLGIIPTAWANPQNPQPMEIHEWGLQEQDRELIAQQQDLHFEFQGIPTEGYAFLASEFSLTLEYYGTDPQTGAEIMVHTETLKAKSLDQFGREHYVATFEIDGTHPNTQLRIMGASIGDGSNNPWVITNEWIATCNIGEAVSQDMAVTGMATDKSTVTLTDANYDAVNDVFHDETVKLTMQLQLPSGFTIPVDGNNNPEYEIEFYIKNDQDAPTNHSIGGTVLKTDANGAIYAECEMGVNFRWGEGTYHIEWVKYHEAGKDTVYLPLTGSNIALQVIRDQTDKAAPVITDAYYTLNGQRQTTGGFRVSPTDTLKFHVAATDASKIMDNTTGLRSWGAPDCDLNAVYDATVGELIVTIPVDQMANTEWYMNYFHVVDVFENINARSMGENFADMKDLYFYLEDANGECNVTTREIHLNINDGVEDREFFKALPRVFDLSETLDSNLPTVTPPVSGLTFQGWFSDNNHQQTSATDDMIVLGQDDTELRLWPAYNQAAVCVQYCYINSRQELNFDSMYVTMPYGQTLQDALNIVVAQQLPHDAAADFQSWTCENNMAQIVDPSTLAFQIEPVYTKLPIHLEYNYMKQNGNMGDSQVMLIYVDTNSTIAQLEQQLMTTLADLPHHSGLTLQGWRTGHNPSTVISLQMLAETDGPIVAIPVYDKDLVTVTYGYIDEKGKRQHIEKPLILPSGATVQDAIDAAVDLSALKHYGKINLVDWEIDPPTFFPANTQPHITVNPVYDKIPVNVNHRYMQPDGTYEWVNEEVLVAPGSTVADVMAAAGLDQVTHYPGVNLLGWEMGNMQPTDEIGWGFGGQTFDAIYDKMPVTVVYGYWDENATPWVEYTTLLVNNGAIYQDVIDAFDAYAAGLKHWSDAGFTQWYDMTGMDPSMPVEPGFETGFMAGYSKTLPTAYGESTSVVIGYYDENLIYREYPVYYDSSAPKTYREMLDEGIATVANAHNSQLTLQEWNLFTFEGDAFDDDAFLNKTAHSDNVLLYAIADYTDLVVDVSYSYRNADGDIVDDMTSVVVARTATYQDVLNKVTLPTDHSTVCGFVEWDFMGLDLTEKVEDSGCWVETIATYEKYPVTYSYTYMDTNGEPVHVTQTKMLDANTDTMQLFETLVTNVPHANDLTFKRWVLTKRNHDAVGTVNLRTNEVAMMAEYEEITPVCVDFAQLNNDLELETSEHIFYVNGTTDDSSYDELYMQAMDQVDSSLGSTVAPPTGFQPVSFGEMFEEYIPMGADYFSGLYLQLSLIYNKAVLEMDNPDGTSTKVVVDQGTDYTLPTTYNGKAVAWFGPEVRDDKVTVRGPITEVFGEYVICYHKLTKTPAKDATCTADGNIEYYTCSECGTFFADAKGLKELTAAELVIAATHKLTKTEAKDATCTADGNVEYWTCSLCDKFFADADGKTELSAADVVVKGVHKLTKTPAKDATCTADGNIEYYTCSTCSKFFADEKAEKELTASELVVKAGTHKLTKTDAKAATYTEDGNTEYYTCSACSKIFADAAGKTETTLDKTVIAKLPAVEVDKVENKEEVKVELNEKAAEEIVDKALEEAKAENKAPSVVIDVHQDTVDAVQKNDATVKAEEIKVTEVAIPTATVEKVAEADKKSTLAVNLTTATVIMDNKAMEAVVEQANGDSVSLVVKDMEVTNLKPTQQAAVNSKKIALTISAELICDKTGENIATKDAKGFNGGTVTMAVPLPEALPAGVKASDLKVYFVADDGTVELVSSKLDGNGNIIFDLKHFSEYVIAADAPAAPSAPATGDSFPVMLITAALLISAAGIVILSRKSKRA